MLTTAIVAQHRAQVQEAMEDMGFRTRVPDEETYVRAGRGVPR